MGEPPSVNNLLFPSLGNCVFNIPQLLVMLEPNSNRVSCFDITSHTWIHWKSFHVTQIEEYIKEQRTKKSNNT